MQLLVGEKARAGEAERGEEHMKRGGRREEKEEGRG